MKITATVEHWPFTRPFHITGHTFDGIDVLLVTVENGGLTGRGEAAGVYYKGDQPRKMAAQVEALAAAGGDFGREELLRLMPAGGARNALDCALWDLEARQAGQPAWRLAGMDGLKPLLTTFTIGADDPAAMAAVALTYPHARAHKLKLIGDGADGERVRAVRAAKPGVWIGVDANQGFTPDSFHDLLPALIEADVKLVEQPFPIGREADLDGLASPIPLAADESVQDRRDIEPLKGRVDVINIKLDKAGGLTEALAMAAEARRLGLKPMVGCMTGTGLAVAPGLVVGQLCEVVDLDAAIFLTRDRSEATAARYDDGYVSCPPLAWGFQ
jgi:L-alanine-DL-glutamate epimerase-like enolase superfamily enzyme